MAGRHLDAAAAMRTFFALGAVIVSVTTTCRQIWPSSSPAPPSGPKTAADLLLRRPFFRPGGLSDRGMSNYGDFLLQAASPVCTEPQSTFADFFVSLLLSGTHCSPSEAPSIPAAKLPVAGLLDIILHIFGLYLDLMQSGSTLSSGRAFAGMKPVWFLFLVVFSSFASLVCSFIFGATSEFTDFAFEMVNLSTPLLMSLVQTRLVHNYFPTIDSSLAGFFSPMEYFFPEEFPSEQKRNEFYDEMKKMFPESAALTALTIIAPRQFEAPFNVDGRTVDAYKRMIFPLIPFLRCAYPRVPHALLVFPIIFVFTWKEACVVISKLYPAPTLHRMIKFAPISSLLCSMTTAIVMSTAPILWRLLKQQFDPGHRQRQVHHVLRRE